MAEPAPSGRIRRLSVRAGPLLLLCGLLVVWEVAAAVLLAAQGPLARSKLSAPHEIAQRLVSDGPLLASTVWVTARGALAGLALGTAIGFVVALVLAQSRWVEDAFHPYILGGQMIPTVALAPIILIALKNPATTRVVVAAYISFFPISLGTLKGLKSTPREGLELMSSYNCSLFQTYRKLRIPAALPFAFAGLKVGAPLAVVPLAGASLAGASLDGASPGTASLAAASARACRRVGAPSA